MIKRYAYISVGLILLLAIGLRIAFYHELTQDPLAFIPIQDAEYHDYWAKGIASNQWNVPEGYSDPIIGTTPFFRPPGYVWAISVLYRMVPRISVVVILQMILGVFNILLCLYLTKKVAGMPAALWCALLMSLYWVFLFFESTLLDVTLHITFLLLFFISMSGVTHASTAKRIIYSLIGGVLLGLATVIRPNFLLFIPVVAIWLFYVVFKQNRHSTTAIVASLVFMIGSVFVISPVAIRNYTKGHEVVLISSNAGLMFYMGNNEAATGLTDTSHLNELQHSKYRSCFDYPAFVQSLNKTTGQSMSYAQASTFMIRETLKSIARHPFRFIQGTFKKTILFWGATERGHNREMYYTRKFYPVLRLLQGNFACIFALFCTGTGLYFMKKESTSSTPLSGEGTALGLLILLFIATTYLSVLPFVFSSQYRMSIIPFMLIFAGYGLDQLWGFIRSRSYESIIVTLIAIIALYFISAGNRLKEIPSIAKWQYQRAASYERLAQIDKAKAAYKLAIEADPHHAWAHGALGTLLAQQGQPQEGIVYLQKALALEPDYPRAQVTFAYLLYLQQNTGEATAILKQVLSKNPDNIQALNTLAWIYGTSSDPAFTNSDKAIALATRLNTLTHFSNPSYLDTLAAAYASGRQFTRAIETALRAEKLATQNKKEDLARLIRARNKRYKTHKRFITHI